jgi:hypothetical protein
MEEHGVIFVVYHLTFILANLLHEELTEELWFDSQQVQENFLFSKARRPALVRTRHPIQRLPLDCSPGLKWPGCKTDQWRTQEFFSGGQQIQLRTENGDLGAVAP